MQAARNAEPLRIQLLTPTKPEWVKHVLTHFDEFLVDHAACERKASATGISFVVKHPDRTSMIEPMIRLAKEELQHFAQVCKLLLERRLQPIGDEKDPYIQALLKLVRHGRDQGFLDRLLVFGIVEARGHERFGILANHLTDKNLKEFYTKITESESRHHEMFLEIALQYFDPLEVKSRLEELLQLESDIVQSLPLRAAVH